MTPLWITTPAICDLLGISRWTWMRYVREGFAPAPIPNLPGFPKWWRHEVAQFQAGYFRGDGKRAYFSKARRQQLAQAMRAAAERTTETAHESRELALVASR